jgi:nitronate monooxygenase
MGDMTSSTFPDGSAADKVAALQARMRLPVIIAPMFLVSGVDLVVGSCRAGVMGAFPGPNARTLEELRHWFEAINMSLGPSDAPYAFNMITHSSYSRLAEELALVAEFQPPLVVTALGSPTPAIDCVHGYGGLVFADVNSPTLAKKALDRGADGLILVCAGAGGHTGEFAMIPFLDEVRGFFDGPIVLAGGLGTGRAVRVAETLGTSFAYVGTRALVAWESLAGPDYRAMVAASTMSDLVASRAITGALAHWLRPSLDRAGLSLDELSEGKGIDFSGDMHADVKAWKNVWSAGQGVGSVRKVAPIAEIVDDLCDEYAAAIAAERHVYHTFTQGAEGTQND